MLLCWLLLLFYTEVLTIVMKNPLFDKNPTKASANALALVMRCA
ncbi:hypothetical protein ISR11_0241 [Streptococcus pyogenes]|nr:hypothetical protein HMPREF1225_0316 [Streptococcus pyogenes UTSW-2]EQL80933.1 hypothetical protein HMPREF1226_1680 [Streptococcus pyogenes UTMEM-1]ESA56321.1 hypothetical protein HMPREF1238_1255 [Streptococcus pyogenes GA40377]SDV80597.1 hypothetical protein ISR11_0241 [Streptococcus pyogenes]